jgi:hypothetical protein
MIYRYSDTNYTITASGSTQYIYYGYDTTAITTTPAITVTYVYQSYPQTCYVNDGAWTITHFETDVERIAPEYPHADANETWRAWQGDIWIRREQERAQEEARRLQLARERVAKREAANSRAESLLKAFLDRNQQQAFEQHRYFEVLSGDGKRRYRLTEGWAGNVQVFDDNDRHVETLCIHPRVHAPMGDHLLAQKLMLETDEEQFRRTANITQILRPRPMLSASS